MSNVSHNKTSHQNENRGNLSFYSTLANPHGRPDDSAATPPNLKRKRGPDDVEGRRKSLSIIKCKLTIVEEILSIIFQYLAARREKRKAQLYKWKENGNGFVKRFSFFILLILVALSIYYYWFYSLRSDSNAFLGYVNPGFELPPIADPELFVKFSSPEVGGQRSREWNATATVGDLIFNKCVRQLLREYNLPHSIINVLYSVFTSNAYQRKLAHKFGLLGYICQSRGLKAEYYVKGKAVSDALEVCSLFAKF